MTVTCIYCDNKTFDFETNQYEVELKDVLFKCIRCPDCGERYLIHLEDDELREAYANVQALLKKTNNAKSSSKHRKCQKKYKRAAEQTKHLVAQKKAEYAHLIHQVLDNSLLWKQF